MDKKLHTYLILLIFIAYSFTIKAQFTKLMDFAGATNGEKPQFTTIISDGTYLYGMTGNGGIYSNEGVIFKIKTNGSGYTKIFDFGFDTSGGFPYGSLLYDGTYLYGMTSVNGANNLGSIFKIKTDGSSFTKLLNFAGATNGSTPDGSLITDGTFLYGMTSKGGANSMGILFKIKKDGSSYTKLLDFAGAANGANPSGDLIYDGTYLYGMTANGGTSNEGVVFKIKTDGSSYTKLLDFTGANGQTPVTSLISDGTFLYGMTKFGGTSSDGIVFKIKTDGSAYTKLLDFTGITNGSNPDGSLLLNGTFLYGIAGNGGTNGDGTIFKIKTDGSSYTNLFDFSGAPDGDFPGGSLYYDGTYYYGMAWKGGANNLGVLFKYQDSSIISSVSQLTNINSQISVYPNPSHGIIEIRNGIIEIKSVKIYNVLGEEVYSEQALSTQPITLSLNLLNGIYFLQVESEQGIVVKKIIINK
ncbi:MAG TPA: choice-of-anchor tandem repeat GloVer-containing protein [Bacteroidia bacterium]|nr:choice-of-anchor tandem repeat GloVer-containing protein [Bacteroidia bacterium]